MHICYSLTFSWSNNQQSTINNQKPQKQFARRTAKFWVHPRAALRVKAALCRVLPLLVYGGKDPSAAGDVGSVAAIVEGARAASTLVSSGALLPPLLLWFGFRKLFFCPCPAANMLFHCFFFFANSRVQNNNPSLPVQNKNNKNSLPRHARPRRLPRAPVPRRRRAPRAPALLRRAPPH
jgi:hypothetical protein